MLFTNLYIGITTGGSSLAELISRPEGRDKRYHLLYGTQPRLRQPGHDVAADR